MDGDPPTAPNRKLAYELPEVELMVLVFAVYWAVAFELKPSWVMLEYPAGAAVLISSHMYEKPAVMECFPFVHCRLSRSA